MLKKILLLSISIFLLLSFSRESSADRCRDVMVFDGSEQVMNFGIDTTGHWWIATYSGTQNRMIIDGNAGNNYYQVSHPIFSQNGERWAYLALDNAYWNIVTNDTIITLIADSVSFLGFSGNSEVLYYSYLRGAETFFIIGDKSIRGINSSGEIYVSYGGEKIAVGGFRGNRKVFTLPGWETPPFDDIIPVGFWNDGSFLYCGRNGNYWEIYKDKMLITESLLAVIDVKINFDGTVAGILGRRSQNEAIGIMISDEYYEPLVGKPYESVSSLVLHPKAPIMAYKAGFNTVQVIVLSSSEFFGGAFTGVPIFTCDGSELYFLGCDSDCFINVDGRKYGLNTTLDINTQYVKKPGSPTIAYSTNSSMVIRYLDKDELVAGKMVDFIIPPIYNWRVDEYQTLGMINNKVYLMVCKI